MPRKNDAFTVLLVNLPWERNGTWGVRAGSRWPHIKDASEGDYLPFPFFLAYAASLLRQHRFNAQLIDALADQTPQEDFLESLRSRRADLLVVETSSPSLKNDLAILQKISRPGIKIALCGPHAPMYEPGFLEGKPFVNFVLCGEYELTLLELVRAVSNGKRNLDGVAGLLWRREDHSIAVNGRRSALDLDTLPWPLRDDVPLHRYSDRPGGIPAPSAQMVSSRGCPYACSFCLWPQVMYPHGMYRARRIEDVVDEMKHLIVDRGFKSIYFDDDTFNIDRQRTMRLCREIKDRGLCNTPWAIMARADLMDEELLEAARDAGLAAVKYGVESSTPELLERCGKKLDLHQTDRMITFSKSLGISVHLTYVLGLPGETRDSMQSTLDHAIRFDPDSMQFSLMTPFPGTRVRDQLQHGGKHLSEDWSLYDGHRCCVSGTGSLTVQDIEKAKNEAYRAWNAQRKRFFPRFRRFVTRMLVSLRPHRVGNALLKTIPQAVTKMGNGRG